MVAVRRAAGADPALPLPCYQTEGAAGADVWANFPPDQRDGLTLAPNDVGAHTGVMGGQDNAVILITAHGAEPWPRMSKHAVGAKLVRRIVAALA